MEPLPVDEGFDFSPALISRGLGRGKAAYFNAVSVGRIGLSMPFFQQLAHTSLSITVPPCLRPFLVLTPDSVVITSREPQRLHCQIPSGFGMAFTRSITACFGSGCVGGTRCSGITN